MDFARTRLGPTYFFVRNIINPTTLVIYIMDMLSHTRKKMCGRISGYVTAPSSSPGEASLFRFDI